ncbi:MAG: hypothetical protein U9P63_00395 [Patescibacteria group bacterium]|nr:hypothetical protein [Patescibacteria group bacterium]
MTNIYLEPDEEIISIIDRLVQADDEQINLIIPAGALVWQSSINLKLLKREADNLKKDVILVVANDLNIEMAKKIGFAAMRENDFSAELAVQKNENQPKKKKDMIEFLADELESGKKSGEPFGPFLPDEEKLAEDNSSINISTAAAEKQSRKRMADIVNPAKDVKVNFFHRRTPKSGPNVMQKIVSGLVKKKPALKEKVPAVLPVTKTVSSPKWPKIFFVFIALAFVAAFAVGYAVLPAAEITIFPKREEISFDLLLVGSKKLSHSDRNENKISLREIEVTKTKSREFSATGEEDLIKKASGFITIYNEFSSKPQPLVVRTRFESPDGKVFRITRSVTVPGAKIENGAIIASAIKVKVVADQPGAGYNIGPADFTIPGFKGTSKYVGFYGKSEEPMTGGIRGKTKVVLSKDIEKAKEILEEELKEEIKAAFEEQIPSDLTIVEESLKEETIKVSSSANEGEPADKFAVEVESKIYALLFSEKKLKEMVDFNLTSMISEDKIPLLNSQQISWSELEVNWGKGEVNFPLHIDEDLAWRIDIQALKNNLAGQAEVEVRKYLSNQPEIESAKVSFWPFWVKQVPSHMEKIKIIVDDYADEY